MKRPLTASGPRALLQRARPFLSASFVLPLMVIAIAFGGLAYRSYQLSGRMEQNVDRMAIQYVRYSSDIGARRLDAASRDKIFSAFTSWQQLKRTDTQPDAEAFQRWLNLNPWITSAVYVPDSNPANSLYVTEVSHHPEFVRDQITQEFSTIRGSVRYTFDPVRILAPLGSQLEQKPQKFHVEESADLEQRQVKTEIVRSLEGLGLRKTDRGFSFATSLQKPLDSFAVRSSVQTGRLASRWDSHKLISALFSVAALLLAMVGLSLAMRGMRRESETTRLRAALIANVSHELRTPLSMIRLGAETLTRGDKLNERERTDILSSILSEVIHLSNMVENVLDITRLRKAGRPAVFAPVYPDEIVMSVIENYDAWLQNQGFSLQVEIDELIEEQLWDREAVSRALLNLVDNAVKYSASDKRIRIELRQDSERIVLEVRDHGIGIPSRDLERIFEPYYRSEFSDTETRRGAGLGLTLAQQVVESHGGTIECESSEGRGSTFRLIFPKKSHSGGVPLESRLISASNP